MSSEVVHITPQFFFSLEPEQQRPNISDINNGAQLASSPRFTACPNTLKTCFLVGEATNVDAAAQMGGFSRLNIEPARLSACEHGRAAH